MLKKIGLVTVGMMALSACSMLEPWDEEQDVVVQEEISEDSLVQANPLAGAMYKVERPYSVNNVWYVPAENYSYSQTGLASWYVPKDANGITANGEQYIPSAVSARHKTLPLPSIVRITNLQNGKSVVARVNDRGPMVNNRLIDVSQKGAELLEMPASGAVEVKVEVLPAESKAVKAELVEAGRVWSDNATQNELDLVPQMPVPQKEVVATASTQEVVYQPQSSKPVVGGSGVYVRLGAFGNSGNAAKAERAANTISEAVTDTTVRNGRTLTIVKAGPFATRAEANEAVAKLRKMGYRDAYIAK
ncbi:MAG: septal ring lytic transglycosylase RlpA family protein [Alphaproteobacteria bacterium]|nr:septal ring lytic transglycosylase RlpA family protein [Alphaproteobacteria bacterium]